MVQVEKTEFSFIKLLFRFFKWMMRTDPRRVMTILFLRILSGSIPALIVIVIGKVIQQSVIVYNNENMLSTLFYWIMIWAILIILGHLINVLEEILSEALRQELQDNLLSLLHEKAHRLRLETFERADFHDKLIRAKKMAEPGELLDIIMTFFTLFSSAITLISVSIVVSKWSILLIFSILITTIPSPIAKFIHARTTYLLEKKLITQERLLRYSSMLLTTRQPAKEIRAFGMANWLIKMWEGVFWNVSNSLFRQSRLNFIIQGSLAGVGVVGISLGVGWAAWSIAIGKIPATQFGAILYALQSARDGMNTILTKIGFFREKLLRVSDLFEYLDMGPEEHIGEEGRLGHSEIRLEDVSFRYPQSIENSLEGISFTLKKGEKIALVGSNGSGKSTLVKVILGLYRPTNGKMFYGDQNLNDLNMTELRSNFTAVFQDFIRYAFTLRENIGFGQAESVHNKILIKKAASEGGADSVVSHLPKGYETLLTNEFSGGVELSGGQWQSIAISRSFMKDVPLVVLDEPTAAIDPKSEADVFKRFIKIAGERSAILVSHRLGIAKICDRVLVLNDGKIVEIGTHDELIQNKGHYYKMWESQSRWYL